LSTRVDICRPVGKMCVGRWVMGTTARISKASSKGVAAARLTAAQRRRVRELMVDEGESRASAEAWVLAFEPAGAA
jgi:hypothetical protein